MTGKRFTLENSNLSNARCNILDYGYGYTNKGLCDLLNELHEENEQLRTKNNAYIQDIEVFKEENTHLKLENEQLKKELSEHKDFALSDDEILCYTCLFCTHKGIYEVDCDVKGHVDVHDICYCYTHKEL